MIFRHFADERTGGHSYLIASPTRREAALVNPDASRTHDYHQVLDELDLKLVRTLCTDATGPRAEAAAEVERRLMAAGAAVVRSVDRTALPSAGERLEIGDLRIEVVTPPRGHAGDVAYTVGPYTFAGSSVLIDWPGDEVTSEEPPEALFDASRPPTVAPTAIPGPCPIENHRASREGVCLERLILEDLHTSLAETRFTPKEARIVAHYVRMMEEGGFSPPSAAALSECLGDVDRTAVHVIIHNVRWKQIDLGRLPLVLAGQTSKWLRGLQTRPEFTSHEREFLAAYFALIEDLGHPPSGPDIVERLGRHRSVQWVRKRAHTIRRKQREFDMPELVLSRKPSAVPETSRPATTNARPSYPGGPSIEMQLGV